MKYAEKDGYFTANSNVRFCLSAIDFGEYVFVDDSIFVDIDFSNENKGIISKIPKIAIVEIAHCWINHTFVFSFYTVFNGPIC